MQNAPLAPEKRARGIMPGTVPAGQKTGEGRSESGRYEPLAGLVNPALEFPGFRRRQP